MDSSYLGPDSDLQDGSKLECNLAFGKFAKCKRHSNNQKIVKKMLLVSGYNQKFAQGTQYKELLTSKRVNGTKEYAKESSTRRKYYLWGGGSVNKEEMRAQKLPSSLSKLRF